MTNSLGIAFLLSLTAHPATAQFVDGERFEFERGMMGTEFRIVLYASDSAQAAAAAGAAFARIDALNLTLSDYLPDSELNVVSAQSGTDSLIPTSDDLWTVLLSAQELAAESGGAFDVTVGPLTRLWRRAIRHGVMPDPIALAAARELVGYRFVELDSLDGRGSVVRLALPGMRLDLGGIAKGYAVDEAFGVLRQAGYARALVDGGGDLRLGDPPPNKKGWEIAISYLDTTGARSQRVYLLSNSAVATSGSRYRHLEANGIRYSHIVDPSTGMGLTVDREVTVIAPTCMEADGVASALSVMGVERARPLLAGRAGVQARFVEAGESGFEMTDIPYALHER
ncbi:MAG TPA: FAD:protein FMN transferase [Rhodothermales bacterium]|nr:FAD:protein FMN transferase [Rhodothermales bacterium]